MFSPEIKYVVAVGANIESATALSEIHLQRIHHTSTHRY